MMSARHWARVLTTACSLVLLVACGGATTSAGQAGAGSSAAALGGAAAAKQLTSLYQQARNAGETQVIVYAPDAPALKVVYDAFSKRFPEIKVQAQLLTGSQLVTRIDEEFVSGKHTADLLDVPGDEIWRSYAHGYLVPYDPPTAQGLRNTGYQMVGPDHAWTTPYAKLNGILYNTDLVKSSQAPKSYAALLQPQWRGKVVITDPRQIGATSGLLIELVHYGLVSDDFVQRFRAQNPVVVPHVPQVAQLVGGGEYPLAIPYGVQSVIQDRQQGAPEGLVLSLKEGAEIAHSPVGLLKGAPHPHAARLLEAWMLTPEGQRALATAGFYGTMPGSPSPAGFPSLSSVKVIPEPQPDEYDNILNAEITNVARLWGA
ncbi:MAG TPA: extracellular solute-binding protein [Candidatus Dormibacteraeota bacterium]|jgi:iron(III) transport system substrate-binding protein|nr:extracellular solute-binding protein [Candidatus Dormibacteraeota bacterium]